MDRHQVIVNAAAYWRLGGRLEALVGVRLVINADKDLLKDRSGLAANHAIGEEVAYEIPRPLEGALTYCLAKREKGRNHCVN
jgi:hypothetical protein